MFFFSSRRRHTRFDCDWSSDVCSSDLRSRRDETRPGFHISYDAQPGFAVNRNAEGTIEFTERGRLHQTCARPRSEEHTSELQSQSNLVCRLLLEKKNIAHVRIPTQRSQ